MTSLPHVAYSQMVGAAESVTITGQFEGGPPATMEEVRQRAARLRICHTCGKVEQEPQRFGTCPLCKEQRIAPPKLFCSTDCQKSAWKEHKKWHVTYQRRLTSSRATAEAIECELGEQPFDAHAAVQEVRAGYEVQMNGPLTERQRQGCVYIALLEQAFEAQFRHDFQGAARLLRRAINMEQAMDQAFPHAHHLLGEVFRSCGEYNMAVSEFSKAMDLSDLGTKFNTDCGDSYWARAAGSVVLSLMLHKVDGIGAASLTCSISAWVEDSYMLRLVAERAVTAEPNDPLVVQMRSEACSRLGDLRQAIRDAKHVAELRGMPKYYGPQAKAEGERVVKILEDKLRQQIVSQVQIARSS
eukprot:2822642-Prymnesium_polylepis.1